MARKPTYEELEQKVKALEKAEAERKRSQEALKETEGRYRDLIESAHDMIQSIRPDGSFGFVNRAWLETLGYGEEELPSLNLFDIIHPDSLQHCQQVFSKIMTGQRVTDVQATFVAKDGREVYVEGGASPRLIRGEVLATHAIFRDISEYRRIEEQLENHREHLEKLVHERTAELKGVNQQLEQEIEEHKLAEEALRESEEKYRSMMGAMDEAVYICSQDYLVEYMNPAMVEKTGRDAIGELCYKVINELDAKCPWCVHNKVQQGESFETEIVSPKDGRSYNISHSPIFHEDGSISKMTIFRDITERKEADEALRQSEERYRSLVENSLNAIILYRQEEILFVNEPFFNIFGYEREELQGMVVDDIHAPEVADGVAELRQRRLAGEIEKTAVYESKGRRKGGEIFDMEISVCLVPYQGEQCCMAFLSDISKRKEAEEALRESKDNLDKAQKVAHVGNWSRDLKTGQSKWSDEMYRTLGLTPGIPEHPTHEYFLSRVHPDDRDHIESMIKKAVEERGSFEYEFRTVPINGSERIIHSRGEVECDDAGVPVRRFGINQDITETRKLQAQVQEVQKTEAIVTLAGGIAHNFNNALTPIIGNIDLLEMAHGQDENTIECLKDMKTSGLRMAKLTSQLLAYAEGGKYNPQILSLSDFVDATLPLIQHTLDPAVRVETDLPLDVKDVEADSTQMQMVLSAIMANSNEAMEGPGRIRISTRNMELDQELIKDYPGLKPGPYACLSIEDEGKGMDEETRRRIFDPFFTTHFMGRGLGMAAVYGIIKNHDGAITVDSELGKGTVVRIYLPACASQWQAGLPAIETEKEVEKKTVSRPDLQLPKGDATILVIEDEEDVMMLIRQVLERLGYRVLQAETGKKAVRLAKTFDGQIDLALLDIKLPDMTGDKVYPLIMAARPDLKVVVCSGYTIDGPPQDILDAGAEGFIQKPFLISAFAEKLKEVLEGR